MCTINGPQLPSALVQGFHVGRPGSNTVLYKTQVCMVVLWVLLRAGVPCVCDTSGHLLPCGIALLAAFFDFALNIKYALLEQCAMVMCNCNMGAWLCSCR